MSAPSNTDELAGSPASPEAKAEIVREMDEWEADYRRALDEFFGKKQGQWKSPRMPPVKEK